MHQGQFEQNGVQPNAHALACDGCGIAKDDLLEIEHAQKRDELMHELFRNAARIRKSMRINQLLRPIFRKYQRACREILRQKKEEAAHFMQLCDYCESCTNDTRNINGTNHIPFAHSKHDLRFIQDEMREIHDKMKSLEELQINDSDDSGSDSSSDSSDSSDSIDSLVQDQEQDMDVSEDEGEEPSSDSSESSESDTDSSYDVEDFI